MEKILILFLFFITGECFSQNTFVVTAGTDAAEGFYNVIQASDGNYVATGYINKNNKGSDVYVVKVDKSGKLAWSKTVADAAVNYNQGYGITSTSDSGFAISGSLNEKIGLLKFDINGRLQWTKQYTESAISGATKILQTNDNGFMIAGYVTNDVATTVNQSQDYLIKTDASGNVQWSKKFFQQTNSSLIFDLKKTIDNNYILLLRKGNENFSNDSAYLIKINNSGTVLWTKSFFLPDGDADGYSVLSTTEGGYFVTGIWYSEKGDAGFLSKFDTNGNLNWSNATDISVYGAYGFSAVETSDGFIMSGDAYTNDSAFFNFIKVNKSGDLMWTKTITKQYKDFGSIYSLINTNDSGFLGVGDIENANGDQDGIIIKFDAGFNSCSPESSFGSLAQFGSLGNTNISPVNVNTVVSNTAFIDSSIGSLKNICSALPFNLLSFTGTLKDKTVNLQWQTANEINVRSFGLEKSSNDLTFIPFKQVSAKNGSSVNTYNEVDNNLFNGKTWYRLKIIDKDGRFVYSDTVSVDYIVKTLITINPNPVNNIMVLNIESPVLSTAIIQLYDANGKLLLQEPTSVLQENNSVKINVSTFSKGFYLLKFIQDKDVYNIKWIKQ